MRLVEKERKKFWSRIPFILGPGKKISKKIEKKSQKIKKSLSELFLAKTGVDRPKNRGKKILPRFPFILGLGKKFQKK